MKALKEGGDLGADQIEWFLFGGTKKNVCGGALGGSLVLCWAGSFEKIANFVLFAKSPANPSSALISVAVVVKPWFEAEKMFFLRNK